MTSSDMGIFKSKGNPQLSHNFVIQTFEKKLLDYRACLKRHQTLCIEELYKTILSKIPISAKYSDIENFDSKFLIESSKKVKSDLIIDIFRLFKEI